MTKKFNVNHYQNKRRIYTPVVGTQNIFRLWVWNASVNKYQPPQKGKCYDARRSEIDIDGRRVTRKHYFETLEEARNWQAHCNLENHVSSSPPVTEVPQLHGPRLFEVIDKWRRHKYPTLQETSRIAYEKIIRLYMGPLLQINVCDIKPETIDVWLSDLKDPEGFAMQSPRRITFRHEIQTLSAILRYYDEYHSNPLFHFPVKKRHWQDAKTGRKRPHRPKDLSEIEFRLFLRELEKCKYGAVLGPLATVQYYQALRISEAAGIFHEDILLNRDCPKESRLLIQRSVFYPRQKGRQCSIKIGFKNSQGFPEGIKELPIFPGSFAAFVKVWNPRGSGLLFSIDGNPIEYRTIQHYYDKAFKQARLPYRATHVLRHGWTREVFNATPDLNVAKELLGDSSDEAAKVYAQRRAGSLTRVTNAMWDANEEACRKQSQTLKVK